MDAPLKKNILIWIASIAGILLLVALGWLMYFKLQFRVYDDYKYKFSIKFPKTWRVVVHPKEGVAVVFIRPKDTALDTIQENFNVVVQPVSANDQTLAAFNTSVKKQLVAVFDKSIKFVEDKPIHWGWRLGHIIAVDAPAPDHLKMVNAWVIREGQAYIMTFLGDMNKYRSDYLVINEMIHSLQLK